MRWIRRSPRAPRTRFNSRFRTSEETWSHITRNRGHLKSVTNDRDGNPVKREKARIETTGACSGNWSEREISRIVNNLQLDHWGSVRPFTHVPLRWRIAEGRVAPGILKRAGRE